MIFEKALAAELESIAGLRKKVFPLFAKKGTKPPFVIYVSSEGLPDKALEGYLDSGEIECEIHIVNSNYESVKVLTRLVLDKLRTFPGREIGVYVKDLTYDMPVEVYEKEVNFYRCSFDIKVRF